MLQGFQNVLIFIFLYIPPLVFFINLLLKKKVNKLLVTLIAIGYFYFSVSTQNLLPFIMVIISIRFLRTGNVNSFENMHRGELIESDYYRYKFDIKTFSFIRGLKYSAGSYGITISINIVMTLILSLYKVHLQEQEIVKELMKVSINKFIYMVPVMVIFAPIVEEFTFRWLLFEKVFRPRIGIYAAALLSSIMFSLVHFNLRAFPVLITIGIINCFLIHKKGYWYAVFNHLVFNSVSAIAMLIQKIS